LPLAPNDQAREPEPRGTIAIPKPSRVHDAVCNAICLARRHRSIPSAGNSPTTL